MCPSTAAKCPGLDEMFHDHPIHGLHFAPTKQPLRQTTENHPRDPPLSERSRPEWRACICFCEKQEGACKCRLVHTCVHICTHRLIQVFPALAGEKTKCQGEGLPPKASALLRMHKKLGPAPATEGDEEPKEAMQTCYFSVSSFLFSPNN